MRSLIYLLFALSGACGLLYQVAWVRQLGLVFGNTLHSASAVTAVFLLGLGVGAWAAGPWADRRPDRALAAYGVAELAVGGLGVALALALPLLPELLAGLWTTTAGADGWYGPTVASQVGRIGLAAVALGPSSALMGATLALLVRHEVTRADEAGTRVGLLYGANTAGAALGALASDLVLIPALGLAGTQLAAAAANAAIGGLALWLARTPRRIARPPLVPVSADRLPPARVAVALLLAGAAAMGAEIAWLRFLTGALGPYRAVLAVLLGTVLVGLGAGSAGAGLWLRRGGAPRTGFAVAQVTFAAALLGCLFVFDPEDVLRRQLAVAPAYLEAGPLGRTLLLHGVNLVTAASVALLPSIALGAAFPLGNALAHDAAGGVGRRTGALYLATTAGNVVGSVGTGFALLPWLGLQGSLWLLAVLAVGAALPVVRVDRPSLAAAACAVLVLLAPARWAPDRLLWATFPAGRAQDGNLLEIREGREQIMVVTGSEEGPARLWTSGHPMTSTTPHAQRYMRLLAHLPLLTGPEPERVLVIAFGAGNTAHAASLHPSVTRLEVVDRSRGVLELAHWFRHANRDVLSDPRVAVFVDDGRHHLLTHGDARYDLIVLEPPPLAAAGVSALYAREFYELARQRLAPGGAVSQWLPAYQVPGPVARSLVRSFVDVLPDAVLLAGSGRELALVGRAEPWTLDPHEVERRLAAAPELALDLAAVGLGDVRELATTFAAGPGTLQRATAGSAPVTDDRPLLEHAAASHLMQTRLPAELFAPTDLADWCPSCADAELLAALEVTARLYASDAFLTFSTLGPDPTSILPPPDLRPATLRAIAHSEGLTRVLHAPDALALRAAELRAEGRHREALRHLDAARQQAPGVPLLEDLAAQWAAEGGSEITPGQRSE